MAFFRTSSMKTLSFPGSAMIITRIAVSTLMICALSWLADASITISLSPGVINPHENAAAATLVILPCRAWARSSCRRVKTALSLFFSHSFPIGKNHTLVHVISYNVCVNTLA